MLLLGSTFIKGVLTTPVKNDYICTWRLWVLEWHGGHRFGIFRVMKQFIFDLDEGILRNLVFKIWTPFRLVLTSDEPIFELIFFIFIISNIDDVVQRLSAGLSCKLLRFEPYRDQFFSTFFRLLYYL